MTQQTIVAPQRRSKALLASVALAAIALIITACGSSTTASPSASASALTGTTWQLTEITQMMAESRGGVIPAADQTKYTIEFNADGTFNGTADCNSVSGTYTTSGSDGLAIVVGASTKVACPEGSMGEALVTRLGNAVTYAIANDELTITLDATNGWTLVFAAGA